MKIDSITFYRFVAAAVVVVFHFARETRLVAIAPGFLTAGPEMVSFFFVLSGFVMVVAYLERDFSSKKYFRARVARIAPVYFLALVLTLLLTTETVNRLALALNIFFLQAWFPPYAWYINAPGWSLSVEMFFYLSFPLLLFLLKPKTIKPWGFLLTAFFIWLFAQIILTNLLNSKFYKPFPSIPFDLIFYFPLAHFPTFVLGAAGGYFYMQNVQKPLPKLWIRQLAVILFGVFTFFLLDKKDALFALLPIMLPFGTGLFAPFFLILILLTAFAQASHVDRWLSFPALVLLGEASYSVYIFQYPLRQFFEAYIFPYLHVSDEWGFLLYFVSLVLFSVSIFYVFEKPMKRLIRAKA